MFLDYLLLELPTVLALERAANLLGQRKMSEDLLVPVLNQSSTLS